MAALREKAVVPLPCGEWGGLISRARTGFQTPPQIPSQEPLCSEQPDLLHMVALIQVHGALWVQDLSLGKVEIERQGPT